MTRRPPRSTLFPTRRSSDLFGAGARLRATSAALQKTGPGGLGSFYAGVIRRSEEHTSELQSRPHLVCRLLLEKKKKNPQDTSATQRLPHPMPSPLLLTCAAT